MLVARDQGSPTWHESLKLLTINLIDVNDNKPQFFIHNNNKPLYTFNVRENNRLQYKVGKLIFMLTYTFSKFKNCIKIN